MAVKLTVQCHDDSAEVHKKGFEVLLQSLYIFLFTAYFLAGNCSGAWPAGVGVATGAFKDLSI